jgi:N-carbamoylputrescine amidase
MLKHPTVTVGLVQMRMSPDPRENLGAGAARVAEAAKQGAQLVCLPELFGSQYFCQTEDSAAFDLAETIPGPTTEEMSRVAKQAGVVLVVPMFERRAAGVYHNSAVIIERDGSIAGLYRKMHIPDDPSYYEKFYFAPGDLGFRAVDTSVGRIGVLICWDQWYPEGARLTALQGAEILFYPTAIGCLPMDKGAYGDAQRDAWKTIQRSHAIANGVFVASVNRVGHETPVASAPGIDFWGSSFVCDPMGSVLQEATTDKEQIILTEVDLGRVEAIRRDWPFLRDRRIDAYSGINQRYLDAPQGDR